MTRWPGCSRAELDPTKLITFAQATRIRRRGQVGDQARASGALPGSGLGGVQQWVTGRETLLTGGEQIRIRTENLPEVAEAFEERPVPEALRVLNEGGRRAFL
jgi:hypothetical protein